MIIEENILITLSLAPQSYHTECFTLNMYYKMQLITATYCWTLFHSLLDQPLAAELSLNINCDVYICNSFLRVIDWIKVEHLRYQLNMCYTHSATLGLRYVCYDVICTFGHACEHLSVSVNAILFQMLISQSDIFPATRRVNHRRLE